MRPVFRPRQSASIQMKDAGHIHLWMKDFQASPVNGTPAAGDNTKF
jgi:hypothetical protein